MADDAVAQSAEMTPQPVANPDAQTTVNDFLDYTEFFPSDLVRSLRLIGDLDQTYREATQSVHELTVKYGKLPSIPASERADPTALRRSIALALDKAIYCRESSYAEASRLYEVAERHKHRIGIIKRKLQAQPEPPSRDPTPVPVSPQAPRSLNRNFSTPHLRLTLDGRYGGSSTVRPRDRKKSRVTMSGARGRSASLSDASDDSQVRSNNDLARAFKRLKQPKDKTPKPARVRVRAPGTGTNVHSSLAGISTSNALARLSPPPDNARPGSKWAPWFKLTEYEMAVLRKKMKKNAVWTPSETMIKRQLELGGRGPEAYEAEKRRCEEAGEPFLDEEPVVPSVRTTVPAPPENTSAPVSVSAPAVPTLLTAPGTTDTPSVHGEPLKDIQEEDDNMLDDVVDSNGRRGSTRDSRRRQAFRDAQELENALKRIKEAADDLQGLKFTTSADKEAGEVPQEMNPGTPNLSKKSSARSSNKRKRDSTPPTGAEASEAVTTEPSVASQDGSSRPPEKRLRVTLPLLPGGAGAGAPQNLTPTASSSIATSPLAPPETFKVSTMQIPLAPAGPGSSKGSTAQSSAMPSQPTTPALLSPTMASSTETQKSPVAAPQVVPQPSVTAASTRPRRESVAPKVGSPIPVLGSSAKKTKVATPSPEVAPPLTAQPTRPRSARGHVPTPKAQSEEPKPNEQDGNTRELRRHSIFSQSALSSSGPTRTSTRKKPPPKGEITNGEGGQKTVTNVSRAQGNKNKKKKKPEEDLEPTEEIDPNEPRYCICDDVSYGSMILCDNHCEREWFHVECVGLKDGELPARRAKWYCPDCRESLGTDAYGNPKVPPTLPGRRGNR